MSTNGTWTTERVIEVIRELAKENEVPKELATAEITGDDTGETLDLDSLGAFSLVDRLEQDCGVRLPDDFLTQEDTVATIAARVQQFVDAAA